MALGDFWARLGGRGNGEEAKAAQRLILPAPPTADDLRAALDRTDTSMTDAGVPSVVVARVHRITAAIRDTIPRLDALGAGSPLAYSVMATATDYLPEAVGGYLRLPRRFADTRPVEPNLLADGRARNRRVTILIESAMKEKGTELGLEAAPPSPPPAAPAAPVSGAGVDARTAGSPGLPVRPVEVQ